MQYVALSLILACFVTLLLLNTNKKNPCEDNISATYFFFFDFNNNTNFVNHALCNYQHSTQVLAFRLSLFRLSLSLHVCQKKSPTFLLSTDFLILNSQKKTEDSLQNAPNKAHHILTVAMLYIVKTNTQKCTVFSGIN